MAAFVQDRLRFLFKIDFIQRNRDQQPEIRLPDSSWIPPTIPQAVTTLGSTGWRRWTANGIQSVNNSSSEEIQVCSLFYNSECCHFLGVPFDCRKYSVKDSRKKDGIGWRKVMFRHTPTNPPISVMGFISGENVLAGQSSPSWMPELIPVAYAYNKTEYCPYKTGIAGDLALLLGFAAFSYFPVPPDIGMALTIINYCFKPPMWKPHNYKVDRTHGTGVVVSIRLDPESDITKQELRDYQRGIFGPIIGP
ncbi:hypothetical protein PRK78_001491 [Emydomyces testavorans]|uniref:Uncharacterized protein n=1 Tax=Emydomyces testavorans TaxID=2070801 RepID=A0AAF0DCK6_9EURO|nr:hypothetical protein PRK78_001491 [Emydomyces testavorans]